MVESDGRADRAGCVTPICETQAARVGRRRSQAPATAPRPNTPAVVAGSSSGRRDDAMTAVAARARATEPAQTASPTHGRVLPHATRRRTHAPASGAAAGMKWKMRPVAEASTYHAVAAANAASRAVAGAPGPDRGDATRSRNLVERIGTLVRRGRRGQERSDLGAIEPDRSARRAGRPGPSPLRSGSGPGP